jgi:hypothetical protein
MVVDIGRGSNYQYAEVKDKRSGFYRISANLDSGYSTHDLQGIPAQEMCTAYMGPKMP